MTIHKKAACFITALLDVYRDEEDRELDVFPKLELGDDATGDITAMLVAFHFVCRQLVDLDGDPIDFTHILNKLAFQYMMAGKKEE